MMSPSEERETIEFYLLSMRKTSGGGEVYALRIHDDDVHKGMRDVPIGARLRCTVDVIKDDESAEDITK